MSGVVQQEETPRSYVIRTLTGNFYRRNRRHVNILPPQSNVEGTLDESDKGNETSLPESDQTSDHHFVVV